MAALLNSKLKIGVVPWNSDYKHVQSYSNLDEQKENISNFCKHSFENLNIIKRDEPIILKGLNSDLTSCNYLMFQNQLINDKWFFSFIDKVEYQAESTVKITHHLDVWQTYQFDITYYKSLILRAIPSKEADKAGRFLAPEPLSVQPSVTQVLNDFSSLDWNPKFVLHTTSFYNTVSKKYEYKGTDSSDLIAGEYGLFINSADELQDIIANYGKKSPEEIASDVDVASGKKTWAEWLDKIFSGTAGVEVGNALIATTSAAQLQDHRDELIGLYAIPSWVKGNVTGKFASTATVSKLVSVGLNTDKLACGYKPRNLKMMTSICRAICVYNRNGFKQVFKPEAFKSNSIRIRLRATQMGTDSFTFEIVSGYNDVTNSNFKIPYSCETRFGYDQNTGLDKTLNSLKSVVSTIGSVGSIAIKNPVGILYGTENVVQSATSMVDALGQRGITNGSTGDFFSLLNNFPTPIMIEVSPTEAECEYIDDYFDVYGYQINEISRISSYMNTRTNWNYIQVSNPNIRVKATNDDVKELESIFSNGVTIWHKDFGNYDATNS